MPVACPVCEFANPDDASLCEVCGRHLLEELSPVEEVAPLDGFEGTLLPSAPADTAAVAQVEGLETTQLAAPAPGTPSIWTPEVVELEPTQARQDPKAPSAWTVENLELETGRAEAVPSEAVGPLDPAVCPWCGVPSAGVVCDSCGRKRERYLKAPTPDAGFTGDPSDTRLCPACFSRVPVGPRCTECGVPLTAG